MDNKYGLGSAKVAVAHHDARHKSELIQSLFCKFCGGVQLSLCATMNDHFCEGCGQYQSDTPSGYSTGRSADY